ncbi:hypothetical protein AVEN_242265-1, partial [Araneus ventricosus]
PIHDGSIVESGFEPSGPIAETLPPPPHYATENMEEIEHRLEALRAPCMGTWVRFACTEVHEMRQEQVI